MPTPIIPIWTPEDARRLAAAARQHPTYPAQASLWQRLTPWWTFTTLAGTILGAAIWASTGHIA
jgi:hypothetical protein